MSASVLQRNGKAPSSLVRTASQGGTGLSAGIRPSAIELGARVAEPDGLEQLACNGGVGEGDEKALLELTTIISGGLDA